jgi:hypothetical protein
VDANATPPALSGKPFCYYHANLHRKHSTAGSAAKRLPVPQIEDARGIQLTLQQVLAAVESPFIHRRAIGHTLYGLQLAIQLLGRIQPPAPDEVVRTLCNPEGEPIHQPDQNQQEQKDPKNQLDQKDQTDQNDPVDPSDPGPDLLAPTRTVCEPPHDCIHCIHQETCDNYQEPDDNPTFEEEEDEEESEADDEDDSQTEDEDAPEVDELDEQDDDPDDENLEDNDDENPNENPEDADPEAPENAHDEDNAETLEDAESPEEQQLITAALRILQKESPPRNRKTSPDPLAA